MRRWWDSRVGRLTKTPTENTSRGFLGQISNCVESQPFLISNLVAALKLWLSTRRLLHQSQKNIFNSLGFWVVCPSQRNPRDTFFPFFPPTDAALVFDIFYSSGIVVLKRRWLPRPRLCLPVSQRLRSHSLFPTLCACIW